MMRILVVTCADPDGRMRDMSVIDLLDRPVYGISQVDRLLNLRSGTARRWIDGYWRDGNFYQPIVRQETTGESLVTWGEFVETRLLAEYRDAGVRIGNLRGAVIDLRRNFGNYPLARARPFLEPFGKQLVLQAQESVDLDADLQLVVLGSNGQLLLSDKVTDFVAAVEYDDEGRAARLRPDPAIPAVMIDPLRSSGDPVVRSVPTEVIAEQIRAGDSEEWIAELYDLELDQVLAAVRFEQRRAA
jgi:uncharacterized protein (DUF433 family)